MWFIADREESLFLLQENVMGWKQRLQRLLCQDPCSSKGHLPSPPLLHKAAELCCLILGAFKPSEWSGFEENNPLPHTFWGKQIQNLKKKKKTHKNQTNQKRNQEKEQSRLVLMLLAYYRNWLKKYTQMLGFFSVMGMQGYFFSSSSKWHNWYVAAWGAWSMRRL